MGSRPFLRKMGKRAGRTVQIKLCGSLTLLTCKSSQLSRSLSREPGEWLLSSLFLEPLPCSQIALLPTGRVTEYYKNRAVV